MPFLRLQPDKVIRYDDRAISPVAENKHLYSLSCNLLRFEFEDEYDVCWQQYHYGKYGALSGQLSGQFDPRFHVYTDKIYDNEEVPFTREAANVIFRMIVDRKRNFIGYTKQNHMAVYKPILGSNSLENLEREDFLNYAFNAFYKQSFYRYAGFKLFKWTTELSEREGFFIRCGLWGYFTLDSFSQRFSDSDGFTIQNRAEKSLATSAWTDKSVYIDWIDSNVDLFKNNPGWVGLDSTSQYRGWLKYVCNNTLAERPSISSYFNNRIEEIESKNPIFLDKVEVADVVNELYENLTQINRFISRELSLYFESDIEPDHPIPLELEERGYLHVSFSPENTFINYNDQLSARKLGTWIQDAEIGYRTLFGNYGGKGHIGTVSENSDFILTCDYGEFYEIPDYEIMSHVGREDNQAVTIISGYHNGIPGWLFACNPYDEYNPSVGAQRHNGRVRKLMPLSSDDYKGGGLWATAYALSTETINNIMAYQNKKIMTRWDNQAGHHLAAAYAHWAESGFYNDGSRVSSFEVFTVSNINSERYSSFPLLSSANAGFISHGKNPILSVGSDYYPSPNSDVRVFFRDYMHCKIRAVADKKYYPVYDQRVSEEVYNIKKNPLNFSFGDANIKALRTGINPNTSTTPAPGDGGGINEDPYYMKYGAYYGGDSEEELADQKDGGSRPVVTSDTEWKKVYMEMIKPEHGWVGNTFHRNLGLYYLNPIGTLWPLGITATMTDINFLLKTDIVLKNENYAFNSQVLCTFYHRLSIEKNYDGIPVWDRNNRILYIEKHANVGLNIQNQYYKIGIDGLSSVSVDGSRAWPQLDGRYGHIQLARYMYNDDHYFETLFAGCTDAQSSWDRLLSRVHEVFPGSGETGRSGPCDSNETFVFWLTHIAQTPRNSRKHTIGDGEHFYLKVNGFCFGVRYD